MKRLLAITMVLVLSFSGTAAAAGQETTLPQLEDEVMCPICGTLLGLSHAPAAERQRVFIRKMIRDGADEQEIKDALVAEYGPQVLALPDDEGINVWAYVVPIAGFILGALLVVWAVLRMRRNRKQDPPGGGTPKDPPKEESRRLDEDLARYDL
jgi:cytochrome c-type biogenesis protein CcmH/NrfF